MSHIHLVRGFKQTICLDDTHDKLMSPFSCINENLSYNFIMTVTSISKPLPVAGVVFALAMPSEGDGYEIPLFEIADALSNPNISVWLHLNLSNSQIQRWLQDTPLIPERVVEMIQEGVNLSRLERIEKLDDCLLMVMNDFHQEFGEEGGDLVGYCDPQVNGIP